MMSSAWFGLWIVAMSALVENTARAQREPAGAPRCRHPACRYIERVTNKYGQVFYYYQVEGNKIMINYESIIYEHPTIQMDCHGASVLESLALPHIETALRVQDVALTNCPLPAAGSLASTFDSLNVIFCKHDAQADPVELRLEDLPIVPTLAAKHFVGLEQVQSLIITFSRSEKMHGSFERNFLTPLRNLSRLYISTLSLPANDIDILPPSLYSIDIELIGRTRLPEVIYSSANLRDLNVLNSSPLDAVRVPPRVRKLFLQTPETKLQLDEAPALQELTVHHWMEPLPPPLRSCSELRGMNFLAPTMRALPEGWLVRCLRLTTLYISEARYLTTLPPTLFIPGSLLREFTLIEGSLESLPPKLFEDMEALEVIELKNNRLQKIALSSFEKLYALSKVDLSSNDLDATVMDAIESHTSYRRNLEINLANNPRISDLCNEDGYSRIRFNNYIEDLGLNGTGVSRICKDWRENMVELKQLDLSNTNITDLSFEDLQYTRNVKAEVLLRGAPVAVVRVTREDYNKAVRAGPSFTSVYVDAELQCDCRLFWMRRAIEPSLHVLDVQELHCAGGGLLSEMSPEELVCGVRGECAAAALPAQCECAARPDDDPDRERWLVRMSCKDSSLADLVPRRIYPFYPVYQSNNQGAYLTEKIMSLD